MRVMAARKKFQLVTKPKNIQLYHLLVGVVLSVLGAHFWTGTDPLWFQGGLCECLAFFFLSALFPRRAPLQSGLDQVKNRQSHYPILPDEEKNKR